MKLWPVFVRLSIFSDASRARLDSVAKLPNHPDYKCEASAAGSVTLLSDLDFTVFCGTADDARSGVIKQGVKRHIVKGDVDALADGLPKHELPHDQADALSDALAERVPECGRGPRLRRVAGRHSGIAVLQAGVQGRSIVECVPQVYPGVLRHVDGSRRGSLLDVRRGEAHCGAERKSDVLPIRVDRA